PGRRNAAVDRERGLGPGKERRREHGRRTPCRALGRQFAQREIADIDRTGSASAAGGHDEFDAGHVAQHAIGGRSPREVDLALLDPHLPPIPWEDEVLLPEPPYVLAACVDELHLKIVDRRVAAQIERDLVVRGYIEWQRAKRQCVASG